MHLNPWGIWLQCRFWIQQLWGVGGELGFCMFPKLPGVVAPGGPQNIFHHTLHNTPGMSILILPPMAVALFGYSFISPTNLWTPGEHALCWIHWFDLSAQHHTCQKGTEQMFLKSGGKVTYFQLQSHVDCTLRLWILTQNRNRLTDLENKLMVTEGERWEGRDKLGVWDCHIHTTIFKIDNQQGPTV